MRKDKDARKKSGRLRFVARPLVWIWLVLKSVPDSYRERRSDLVINGKSNLSPRPPRIELEGKPAPSIERMPDDPDMELQFYTLVGDLDISW